MNTSISEKRPGRLDLNTAEHWLGVASMSSGAVGELIGLGPLYEAAKEKLGTIAPKIKIIAGPIFNRLGNRKP